MFHIYFYIILYHSHFLQLKFVLIILLGYGCSKRKTGFQFTRQNDWKARQLPIFFAHAKSKHNNNSPFTLTIILHL